MKQMNKKEWKKDLHNINIFPLVEFTTFQSFTMFNDLIHGLALSIKTTTNSIH